MPAFILTGNFSGPKDIIAFRGQIVQMHCVPNIQTSYFVWLIDEATIADSGYSQYITFDGNYTLNISSADVLASKRFQCAVQINGIRYYSGNATVLIQGTYIHALNMHVVHCRQAGNLRSETSISYFLAELLVGYSANNL